MSIRHNHSFIRPASPSHREPGERSLFTERQTDAMWAAAFATFATFAVSFLAAPIPGAQAFSFFVGCGAAVGLVWHVCRLVLRWSPDRSPLAPRRLIVPPSTQTPPWRVGERSPFDWAADEDMRDAS